MRTAAIDLSAIGSGKAEMSAEQWYYALAYHLSKDLELGFDLAGWWDAHRRLPPVNRMLELFAEAVLARIDGRVVVFVNEIDTTIALPFSDDFFAAIRACHNARATAPAYRRLSFVLLGVASLTDLIKDGERTPFNVGRRIELADFSFVEARALASGPRSTEPRADRSDSRRLHHSHSPKANRPRLDEIGCTGCHIQNLRVNSDRRVADVETRFNAAKGIFNRLFAAATMLFNVVDDGQAFPQLLPKGKSFLVKKIFADFKRHDLGPAFHERQYDGSLVTKFMTEPLWGVGTTAPYGHDGRSVNLEEAILRHGGEAQQSRERFASLSDNNQRKILEFLATLVLFPPDDTASNLNPGNPGTNDPQDPTEHGSINLGALFQIPDEGPE